MAESQSESSIFSVRIVSIDYYIAPPIPGLDISYSSFHGRKVNEVPVLRIYGSTPAGQKTCVHIHGVLPYLYVPCSEISLQLQSKGEAFASDVSLALEKALKLKGNSGSKRQHVHGYNLVRARKLYGYHSSEELFMKIYLYYPQDITRAANLLLNGAVLEKSLQPYESHIPFVLQFLVDYNLYGMGLLHLMKLKFRHPVPDAPGKKLDHIFQYISENHAMDNPTCKPSDPQADPSNDAASTSPVWTSSKIPTDWMWKFPSTLDALDDDGVNLYKRQSVCELEGDAAVEDIRNQHSKLYTSFSQTHSDVKMVQSLVSIWEEEYRRTGLHEAPVSSDPGKPSPKEVLETFSLGMDYEKKLTELCERPKSPSVLTPLEKDERLVQSLTSSANEANIIGPGCSNPHGEPLKCVKEVDRTDSDSFCPSYEDHDKMLIGEEDVVPKLSTDEVQVTPKIVDEEALGLLRWLATSQAAQDVNSDDELLCETILGPLLPAANMDQVLERASQDYGSESQKECQDILDSVEDLDGFEGFNKGKCSSDDEHLCGSSSEETIPQLDGAVDDMFSPCGGSTENSPDRDLNIENERSSKCAVLQDIDLGSCSYKKEKSLWGSLPFHETQKVSKDSTCVNSCRPDKCASSTKDSGSTSFVFGEEGKQMDVILVNADTGTNNSKEGIVSAECSLRDIMRSKRHYRSEQLDCGYGKVKNFAVDSRLKKVWSKDSDFQVLQSNEPNLRFWDSSHLMPCLTNQSASSEKFYENKSTYSDCSVYGKLPLVDSCDGLVQASSPNAGEIPGSETVTVSSQVCLDPWLSESETLGPSVLGGCGTLASKKPNSGVRDADAHEDRPSMQCADEDLLAPSTKRRLLLVNENSNDRKKNEDVVLSGLSSSVCMVAYLDAEQVLSIGMTSRKKPPNVDLMHEETINPSTSSIISRTLPLLDGKNVDGRTGRALDDLLPFFLHKDKKSIFENNGSSSPKEAVMGVPIHYRNDGSYMYILTPVYSPPSADIVCQWLSSEHRALRISSGKPLVDDLDKSLPQPATSSHTSYMLDLVNRGGLSNSSADENSFPENLKPVESEGVIAKACLSMPQDISQISGPDGTSKATPLSQIGFRDPASVGGVQQLTLLSVEVQAESRGDLRPDPRLDAIKMIALAIQTDSGSAVEVVLLLHNNIDSTKRNLDGISYKVLVHYEEKSLFQSFMKIIYLTDPDVLIGWDIQGSSLGYLAERASQLGISLLNKISRTPYEAKMLDGDSNIHTEISENLVSELVNSDSAVVEDMIIEDEWGRTHASGIHIGGRIVLNIWRLMRNEVKLNIYTLEAVSEAVLRRKIPYIHHRVLTKWFNSGPGQARFRCIEYMMERAKLNLQLLNQLDMINRTSELARVFGIEFFSVLSRGSQFRVESMLLRLAHSQNYLAVSPGNLQVASQPAMECLPLVMEPESGFYADPVVVLDFQSLYPSMIIAYNLCFSTCLGKVAPSKVNTLGVSSYSPERQVLEDLKDQMLFTPNGVMYVPPKVRKGILPRLLEEILSTRIMVKQGMKKLAPSQKVLQRVFNARQLALKLIANVTYGYTAAGFSGRMPCAELADSIVQCGRRTLENAISFVNNLQEKWKAKVIYGDTDSMFVLLKGRTVEQAFRIGQEIASAITAMNPNPVTLKMEKVYAPCFLLTKKRYVGYSFESPEQVEPTFDAKGIETVRRDTCAAVAKTMEQSLRLFFEHQDILEIKTYLLRQWKRILSGRVSIQDFVFAKEVRLGTYSTRGSSSLPPAAIVATKAMRIDPRAEPRYAERIPYVVIYGEPGARLVDMVVDPMDLLAVDSPYRLNSLYYINKQIIPALQRAFGLVGANLKQWFSEMPRPVREAFSKQPLSAANPNRTRIDSYFLSKHCILCGELVQTSSNLCNQCLQNEAAATTAIIIRTSKLESEMQHLTAICQHCGGGDGIVECGVKCTSLACSVFYERLKVQKELRGLAAVAAHRDLYPKWTVEWF